MYLFLACLAPIALFGLIPGLAWFEDKMLDPDKMKPKTSPEEAADATTAPTDATPAAAPRPHARLQAQPDPRHAKPRTQPRPATPAPQAAARHAKTARRRGLGRRVVPGLRRRAVSKQPAGPPAFG